jgi:hypothetical protein
MEKPLLPQNDELDKRWSSLESRKGTLHERNERYSRWTLPYLYPINQEGAEELDTDLDSIGARATNHLGNKLVETLFPSYRPFIKLELDDDLLTDLEQAGVPLADIDKALVRGEKRSIKQLDKMGHRTAATTACKYLVVTGNALMYYPDGKAQVYNTRDYCVVRDLSGTVIEIITRDCKAFETFKQEVQDKLRQSSDNKDYESETKVTLYTQIKLEDNGKFHVKQAADKVSLDTPDNQYARKDLPWIPLSWNLVRGEDYGRGMVEDYRGAFAACDVLSQALIEGVISAATLKFLVNPASMVDVAEMNKSPNGSYHSGRDGDVTAVKSDKHLDFQQVRQVLEDYHRQIGQAFLLHSEVTRDAERVTTVEIRKDAQELEMAFGGIYSRFTEDWQEPVAGILLSRQNIQLGDDTIYPTIVTGLDTLSRMGDLDNYRMFVDDLSMVNALPEAVQAYLKINPLMTWVGNNRGVDYSKFVKTEEEVQQEMAEQQQQQQQLMEAEAAASMAADAGTEIAKQEI